LDHLDVAAMPSFVGLAGGKDALAYVLIGLGRVEDGVRYLLDPGTGFTTRSFVHTWSRLPYWDGARDRPDVQRAIAESARVWRAN
jgi:hypothetical protein